MQCVRFCSFEDGAVTSEGLTVTTRFGFLSTYPPTLCGLATFNAALYNELVLNESDAGRVVRVVDTPQTQVGDEVVTQLVNGELGSIHRAVRVLNEFDVTIVQHEYGIYGGPDGDEILTVLSKLAVPSIVVLHTVLAVPTNHQREVLEEVVALASAVVTMTTTARMRLETGYAVDMSKVSVIPHGAPVVRPGLTAAFKTVQPTILTWGLIGPGKGIEWGIRAMNELRDMNPMPRYLVAGQTHPKVLAREGEAYRNSLTELIQELGLGANVVLDNHYRHTAALVELINSADVVLLPYDSTEQVTSGVLIEALAALKPVVATPFPHAVELLSDGDSAGVVVPHHDPKAIADVLREVLTDANRAARMSQAASALSSGLSWPAVADKYRDLAQRLMSERVAA
jgi:glycosyltransferase involved in cell wall biosynthesis